MTRFLHNIRERFKSMREGRRETVCRIETRPAGLTVRRLTMENAHGELDIAWSNIHSAKAFKRDLFTVDCICLQFTLADGKVFEVNEDMKGWREFLFALPSVLPGFPDPDSWHARVALPPFKVQMTDLWKRIS